MGAVADIVRAVAAGDRSAEEVVRRSLDRLETVNPGLGAVLSHDADRALADARAVDAIRADGGAVGALCGVPVAVKDNICTANGPTTCGSRMLESFQSQYDAFVVERLASAGAIILGKTNLDEFAMGSSTENSAFGSTVNPWDVSRVAGGSSGGSAAAVAAGIVPAALGSDTGGSIRQPASFCGVVGLKPTYGRVSRFGLVAFASSLDQIGPITTDAEDAALLLGVIAGHDARDSTSVDVSVPEYVTELAATPARLRIGVCQQHFDEGLDGQVASAVRSALKAMESAGAEIVAIELPHTAYAVACYYLIASAEASSNLARFDGIHYGRRAPNPADVFDLYAASRGSYFGDEVKRRIMLGTHALSSGYYDAYYLKAQKVRRLIRRDFERALSHVDVIASPVAPTTAFAIGEKAHDPLAMYLSDIYTIAANLTGHCAVSIPCGQSAEGLPIGLQLTGGLFEEGRLLSIAHHFQGMTDHHASRPPIRTTA